MCSWTTHLDRRGSAGVTEAVLSVEDAQAAWLPLGAAHLISYAYRPLTAHLLIDISQVSRWQHHLVWDQAISRISSSRTVAQATMRWNA